MTKQGRKSANLAIRIDPAVRSAAEQAAAADRRTLSALVQLALEDWLRARGFLPAPELGRAAEREGKGGSPVAHPKPEG